MTLSRSLLDEAGTSLEALRQLDATDIEWSSHAADNVLKRRGLHQSYVEDVVAQPYGEVYRQWASDRLVLYDPDTETPTGKPRAVVVVLEPGRAVIVTAYNVDEWRQQQFEDGDGYEWVGSLRDDCTED